MTTLIAPKLRFPGFAGGWLCKNLLSLSKNGFSNGVFNDPAKVGTGYKLINVKDMYTDGSIHDESLTLVAIDKKEFQRNKVEYGDIFFTRSSLVKEGIAYSNIYLGQGDDITYDGHLIRMQPNSTINPIFLKTLLATPLVRKQLIVVGTTTTMTTIGQKEVSKVNVFLPDKREQKKIANFLGSVDEKVAWLQKKTDLLKNYKKGVSQAIFTQAFRFKDENDYPYPDWEEDSIGGVAKNHDNLRKPISGEKRKFGTYPYYGANGIVDYVDGYIFDGEYVLVAEDGVVDTSKYPIHLTHGKFWANNHTHILKGERVTDRFLYYALQNIKFMRFITGSAQTKLNGRVLSQINLGVPSAGEQQKIAEFLTVIDDKIKLEESKLEQANNFKKGLLQQMFI